MTLFPPVTLLFLSFMFMGILISVSAPSWPMAWVGLEINLISLTPLIVNPMNTKSANAATFYFFAQVTGSSLFLIGPMLEYLDISVFSGPHFTTMTSMFGLLIKLGSAPAHLWFPAVVGRLPFWSGFLLMTTQKIAPLALCANLMKDHGWAPFIMVLGVANAFVGAHGAFVQSDIRQLLAYSSISHLGWMLCLLPLASALPLIYLAGYAVSLAPVIYHFHPLRITSVKRFSFLTSKIPLSSISLTMLLLNLSGLPPFGGFFVKVMALTILTSSGYWAISLALAFASMLTLSAYAGLLFLVVMNGISSPNTSNTLRAALAHAALSVPIMVALPYLMALFAM